MGGGEVRRRPCGKRRDLHQAPFSSLEALATPCKPAVLHPQPPPPPPTRHATRWDLLASFPRAPPTLETRVGTPRSLGGGADPARAPARAGPAPVPPEPAKAAAALSRGRPGPLPRLLTRPRPEIPGHRAHPRPGPFSFRRPGFRLVGDCSKGPRGYRGRKGVGDGGRGPWRLKQGRGGQAAPPFPTAVTHERSDGPRAARSPGGRVEGSAG